MPKKRKKMDKKALKEFEENLLKRRELITSALNAQLNTLQDEDSSSDEVGDSAKAVEEEDVAAILAETEASELDDIREALFKIKNGTFGICEGCDEPIPLARLEAIPNAAYCLKCKIEAEKHVGGKLPIKHELEDE